MAATQQATKNAITLKGSAALIAEYLNYGVNSILYQRGIYPSDSFTTEEHFGMNILVSTNDKITSFLKTVLDQTQEWLIKKKVQKISMIVSSVGSGKVLEQWDFSVDYENHESSGGGEETGKKELKIIQKEIRDVLRQICATITFLPLLEDACSFDIQVYTSSDCEVPNEWDESVAPVTNNFQQVQLKTFSTAIHKMGTLVSYRVDEI